MKRVAFIVPWGEALGGAELMLLSLLRHLDRDHYQASVLFLQSGSFQDDVAKLGVQTTVLPAGRLRDARRFWLTAGSLASCLDDQCPDVVCAWATMAQTYSAAARRRRRRSRSIDIWWQHGIPHGHWLDRVATALPAAAVGCSSHAGAAAQAASRPRRDVFVVHPGTDPHPGGPARDGVRDELGIAPDRFVIGITGRLQPWKNHTTVLKAVARLRAEGFPAHALVVGGTAHGFSSKYPAELDAVVRRLALDAFVTRTGHVTDARRLLPAMDVLVNASDNEPFGISLIEAMAARVPVLAVNAGGPAEIVVHQRSGLLVRSSATDDLADGLRLLAADENLRATLGSGAQQRFYERFTAAHMASGFADAIERLPAT